MGTRRVGPADRGALRSAGARRGGWIALAVAVSQLGPGPVRGQTSDVDRAIAAARAGGVRVVCRHAITRSMREVEPVDYDDPSTQRLLSEEGEEQSRAMGRAYRALGVEPTRVVASPMRRARRTAELMTDRPPRIDSIWHTNGGEYGGPARDARAAALAAPVGRGVHLVVSHIGTMSSVLPEARGDVEEGDCVVVRPAGDGYRVVGIVPWRAWIRAAEAARTTPGARFPASLDAAPRTDRHSTTTGG